MLGKDDVQGQNYAATALTNIAADPTVQEQMVALGALPQLIAILRDNMGAGPAAAGPALPSPAPFPPFPAPLLVLMSMNPQ